MICNHSSLLIPFQIQYFSLYFWRRIIFPYKTETIPTETSLKITESQGIGLGQETDGQGPRTRNQDLKIENLGPGTEGQDQETGGLDPGTESLKTVLAQKTDDLDLEIDITRNIKRTGLATVVGLALAQETVNIKV